MIDVINSLQMHHLVFIFALVFIFVYRGSLTDLIKRTKKITKSGLSTVSSPEIQREMKSTTPEAVQQLMDMVGTSIVIESYEDAIRKDLNNRNLDLDGDATKVLLRHLAATQILLEFERTHNLIFGSQIYLLKKLNEVVGQGRSNEYVKSHIDDVRTRFSDQLSDWSSEQYLSFLIFQKLIIFDGSNYHITNLGVEYLIWLARSGQNENRAL